MPTAPSAAAKFQRAHGLALEGYLRDPSSIGLTVDLGILARVHSALPVYAHMGGALLISSTGQVLQFDSNKEWTASSNCTVITEDKWISVAFGACEQRYPQLRGLLPPATNR